MIAVSVCVSCRESMGQSDDTSVSTQPSGATTTGIYDGLDTKKYDGYLDCFLGELNAKTYCSKL